MGGRDSGWIQLYGENHQQAYDNCMQAVRIAEHMDVRTPAMHMYDGYVISGAIGPLVTLEDEKVREFIGPYRAVNPMLDIKHPVTVGPFDGLHGWYFEHKVSQNRAMDRAFKVITRRRRRVRGAHRPPLRPARPLSPRRRRDRHRRGRLHRRHHPHGGRQAAGQGRQGGHGAGAGVPPLPRTPPYAKALEHVKVVGVMDRADSFGAQGGPVFLEIARGPLRQRPAAAGAAVHLRPGRARHLPRQHRAGVRRARRDGAERQERASTARRYLNLRED